MRILITGIDGFVAPYLAKILMREHKVYGTYFAEPKKMEGISYLKMDILDVHQIDSVVSHVVPERIYHLAGFGSVGESWKNQNMVMRVNAEGTKNLLESVLKARIHPRILLVSSAEIYGKPKYLPIDEAHSVESLNPYATSKLAQEKVISEYSKLDAIIARSFSHTGPGQSTKFVCSDFAYNIAAIEKGLSENTLMHGSLEIRRDFLDVRDVVKAYILLAEKGKPHEPYNVCSGKAFSIGEILDTLIEMSNVKIIKKLDAAKVRKVDIPILQGNNTKLVQATGWKPQIEFKQTLNDILEYWRQNIR